MSDTGANVATEAGADVTRVAIVVPARHASTRYPGKPLVEIRGATGAMRPLIRRSWDAACAAAADMAGNVRIVVATDDGRIADCANSFGAEVMMTPETCGNGTERCAAVLDRIGDDIEIVVNLQGDALLTPPWFLSALVDVLRADPSIAVATPAVRATPAVHRRLLDDQAAGRVGGTTVATAADGRALYFTKAIIPHVPDGRIGDPDLPVFLHVGVYAYRRAALAQYAGLAESVLEGLEGLEQLRFLDGGVPVQVVEVDPRGCELWELNNPSDLAPIEVQLAVRGMA
ncbi:3-deoxy-manno-octulosonate cytidylyltransferase [Sphingomonas montana]|uniref:3-deoxy-manno-octulosonate cytidylyltransferase n=1 Tax=Sphingomonas montana TaxID=1843236 RepID=UPI00096BD13F|nr:manno-octulosonate cytidylyltransferase [Sphingomonas montana]